MREGWVKNSFRLTSDETELERVTDKVLGWVGLRLLIMRVRGELGYEENHCDCV